jgi:hypothetical protein
LVEGEIGFSSEKGFIPTGSANREYFLLPVDPMPGQKSIRLAKKGGGSSFPNAGFRRFSPAMPQAPRLFAETETLKL